MRFLSCELLETGRAPLCRRCCTGAYVWPDLEQKCPFLISSEFVPFRRHTQTSFPACGHSPHGRGTGRAEHRSSWVARGLGLATGLWLAEEPSSPLSRDWHLSRVLQGLSLVPEPASELGFETRATVPRSCWWPTLANFRFFPVCQMELTHRASSANPASNAERCSAAPKITGSAPSSPQGKPGGAPSLAAGLYGRRTRPAPSER